MTPEERAEECVKKKCPHHADKICCSAMLDEASLIAAAIRAAVDEEREQILDNLNALAVKQLWYANEPGGDGDQISDRRTAYFHAANMLGVLRMKITGEPRR